MSVPCEAIIILIVALIVLECDTTRPNIREGILPERRDYRPSKWVANSAMDVWYGNKSMIDVLSREFSDIMYKLTGRPVRSTLEFESPDIEGGVKPDRKVSYQVSRVEINFINEINETVQSVHFDSKQPLNATITKE